jgi:hypothetical protein
LQKEINQAQKNYVIYIYRGVFFYLIKLFFVVYSSTFIGRDVFAMDHLLNYEVTSEISIGFRQDGRVLYFSIANNTGFVLTSVNIACFEKILSKKGCENNSKDFREFGADAVMDGLKNPGSAFKSESICSVPIIKALFKKELAVNIMPKKTFLYYYEAEGRQKIGNCYVDEARGHERSWYELR